MKVRAFFRRAFCVVRTKGFAPLAARPAPTLLTSPCANKLTFILAPQGKAFCSRKTAPTLKSLRAHFFWCGRRDLNSTGNYFTRY